MQKAFMDHINAGKPLAPAGYGGGRWSGKSVRLNDYLTIGWRGVFSELPLSPVEALCEAVKEITERGE